MKPWELLGRTETPDGQEMTLTRHDTEYVIATNGQTLMSSRMHGSEEALATLACRHARALAAPCVFVGGLGMGFTLRATLDVLPPEATVLVAELVAGVVDWNRGPLAPLAGHPLEDKRVSVEQGDAGAMLRASARRFDAVLLDVDNGPGALTATSNSALYDNGGVTALRSALKPGGVVGVWSAWEDRKFEQRLRHHGFAVQVERVRARLRKGGPRHVVILGYNRSA